jgi:hypothetical protein
VKKLFIIIFNLTYNCKNGQRRLSEAFQHLERELTINCGIMVAKYWLANPLGTLLIGSKIKKDMLTVAIAFFATFI